MTPIEATVTLMQVWSATGKLNDLNAGQTLELTAELLELFSGVKPKRTKAKPEAPKPVHVNMGEPKKEEPWD